MYPPPRGSREKFELSAHSTIVNLLKFSSVVSPERVSFANWFYQNTSFFLSPHSFVPLPKSATPSRIRFQRFSIRLWAFRWGYGSIGRFGSRKGGCSSWNPVDADWKGLIEIIPFELLYKPVMAEHHYLSGMSGLILLTQITVTVACCVRLANDFPPAQLISCSRPFQIFSQLLVARNSIGQW